MSDEPKTEAPREMPTVNASTLAAEALSALNLHNVKGADVILQRYMRRAYGLALLKAADFANAHFKKYQAHEQGFDVALDVGKDIRGLLGQLEASDSDLRFWMR